MGPDDPDDRISGPGWRDRLISHSNPPQKWRGKDHILTRRRAARPGWHGVLCDHLDRYEGQTLDELAGNLGWFYLRLTRQAPGPHPADPRSRVRRQDQPCN